MQQTLQRRDISIEVSNKGLPVMWEHGGMESNGRGTAFVIGNHRGEAKRPIFVRTDGKLACAQHALFVVKPGDVVIEATCEDRRIGSVYIYRIDTIDRDNLTAMLSVINEFKNATWIEPVPEMFDNIINAAILKATTHHCRAPCYVL